MFLSRFGKEEFEKLPEVIDKACDMALAFGTIGIERTMKPI